MPVQGCTLAFFFTSQNNRYPGHTSEHSPDSAERRVNHHAICDVRQIKKCDRKWEWEEMQNGEFHDLHSSPNIIRVIEMKKTEIEGTRKMYEEE